MTPEDQVLNLETCSEHNIEKMEESVPQGSFVRTFLDSPIISSDRDSFLLAIRAGGGDSASQKTPQEKKAEYLIKVIGTRDVLPLEPESYSWFLRELMPDSAATALALAHRCSNAVLNTIRRSQWSWAKLVSESLLPIGEASTEEIEWYSKMLQLNSIITTIAVSRARAARNHLDKTSGNVRYVGDQFYGCITLDEGKSWVLITFTQLLMFKDICYVRFNAYLAARLLYIEKKEMKDALTSVIQWQMKCIGYYGNKGYELLKSIESLSKCNLTRMSDRIFSEEGAFQMMREKVRDKERKLSGAGAPLTDELCAFLESIKDIEVAVEVFGWQKLSGHPLVDPALAGASVREEAKKKINYSPSDCQRLRNNCCRLYTEGYIRKNGRWPPLVFPLSARRTRLYHLYSVNELNLRNDSYPLGDWTSVKFAAHLTFEGFDNYLDLMDDKAVSLYREDCRSTWEKGAKPQSSRRLLVELLSREDFSVMAIVERVRRGDIPLSWLIVSLYPKEREMKIAARLFSMMVIEMRVFFAACEANLAEYVYPCLQAQTMTLSRQEVKELFVALTKEHEGEDLVRLYLEVDLSRWNLRWHPEVVDPVGCDLNDMFGMEGVFNTIHHFFEKCLVLVRVNSAPPPGIFENEIPESDLCFRNHRVGFEGIAQKLWSFLTFGMIDLAMIDHEGPYYLVGQGDNQVLLMSVSTEGTLDRNEYIKSLTRELTERIELECRLVGQEAKPEECIQSTSVVTYSKNVYIRGVEYHTAIKGCSRVFPSASSDFPSINGSIGSISASCTSASELMKNPLDAFRLMLVHLSLYLYGVKTGAWPEACLASAEWRKTLTEQMISALLILPNDLGGCMIAPITHFLYKGGADSLSKSYSSLKFYQDGSPMVRRVVNTLREGTWFDKKMTLETLLEDPYSLPVKRPRGAEQSMRGESVDCIRAISKNRDLNQILAEKTDSFLDEVLNRVRSCDPFNPILLSDLLGFSVIGVRSTLQNMFTSTGTVQALLHKSGGFEFSLCLRVLMTGLLFFQDVVRRIVGMSKKESRIDSIYKDVKVLRDSWKEIASIPHLTGVTTFMPFEFDVEHTDKYAKCNSFRTLYRGRGMPEDNFRRGEWKHYDGLDTQERRSEYGYKIVTSTTSAAAVKKLVEIATQPGVSESFVDFVSKLAQTRTSADIKAMMPLLSRAIGGSIAHRYSSTFGSKGAYGLNTTTWSTHCFPYTDTAAPFSASAVDYPIMIQEMMVAGISAARMFSFQGRSAGVIKLLIPPGDYDPLPDKEMTVTGVSEMSPPSFPGNRLVFDDNIKLRKVTGTVSSGLVGTLERATSALYLVHEAVRASIRSGYMKNNAAIRIIDSNARFSAFKLDVLEMIGLGVKAVCDILALEIAAIAGNQTMSIFNAEVRWTPVPAIVSLSTSAAFTLSSLVQHPSVRDDPFISDLVPSALFKYIFSGGTIKKRLQTYISNEALGLLLRPGSKLYKSPEVIFPDDNANTLLYLASRRARLNILQSVMVGEIPPQAVSSLTRIAVLKPMKGALEDEEKARNFEATSSAVLSWAEENHLPVFTAHTRHLVEGKFLLRHDRSMKEVIRLARAMRGPQGQPVLRPIRGSEVMHESFKVAGRIEDIVVQSEGWERPFRIAIDPESRDEVSYRKFHVRRMIGREYGCESNAGYSYAGITDLTRGRVVIILGCGYGSGAAVLLKTGSVHVIGLDYLEDLKEEELLRGNVVPPAVARVGLSDKFTRVEVTPESRGDVYERSTLVKLRDYSAEGSFILVDIRVRNQAQMVLLFQNLLVYSSVVEGGIRFIGDVKDVEEIVGTLAASGAFRECRVVEGHGNKIEAWVFFKFNDTGSLKGGKVLEGLDLEVRPRDLPDLSYLGGGVEYIEKLILGPYYGLSIEDVESSTIILSAALKSSIGGMDHRFSYDQFTEVLHAHIFVVVRNSKDPLAELEKIIEEGRIEIVEIGSTIILAESRALLSMLLTLLPRTWRRALPLSEKSEVKVKGAGGGKRRG